MKIILFIAINWFIVAQIFGQSAGAISGRVLDSSGIGIEDVTINIESHAIGSISGKDGFFQMTNVPIGKQVLLFSHVGYSPTNIEVEVKSGETSIVEAALTVRIRNLDELTISGDHEKLVISRLPYIETSIDKDQLNESAIRDVGDYLRSSKNISGIRKGGTQLDPVVRGFKYSQLNVMMNDGQKIEGGCPNRMDPATAHVEIEDIESIDIIKGPYALRYGPAFGALINLQTDKMIETDAPYIKVNAMKAYESNWNGNKEQLSVTGGNQMGFIKLSGGRKEYGNYKDGNGNEVKSSFLKYNYKGQLGINPFKHHQILLSMEESKGRDIRFPTLPMDERKDDTRLLSADYKIKSIGKMLDFINFKAYQSKVRHEMDNKYRPFSDTVVAISIIDAMNYGGRAEVGLQTGLGQLAIGIDAEWIEKDGQRDKNMIMQPGLPVKVEKLWNNARIMNDGIFAVLSGESLKWTYVGAIRLDMNSGTSDAITIKHPMLGEIYVYGTDSIKTNYTNLSFNAGITYNLDERFAISLAAGRAKRSPDMTERFIILLPIGYDKFDYLGNPQLKPEANNQLDLTFQFKDEKIGYLQLNGFYSLINDYITGKRLPPSVQKPLTADVLGVKQFYNAGNARLRGFELSYATPTKYNLGATLFTALTYGTLDESLQHIMNEQGEVIDDQIIYDDALTEIPPFESTLTVHYNFLKGKLTPRFNIRMVAAQNHVSRASYEMASQGFALASFSVNYVFNRYLTVSGGVNNIFDQAYYEHLNRNIIGSSMNLYEPGRSFYINLFFKI